MADIFVWRHYVLDIKGERKRDVLPVFLEFLITVLDLLEFGGLVIE